MDTLKEIAELCGIKKYLTTHMARHTFATTILLEQDVPIETVSQLLGHRSIRYTDICEG
jgi:site-specific recombinase XerD